MNGKRRKALKINSLADTGENSPINYIQGLMVSPSVQRIKIKGEYGYKYNQGADQKNYLAIFKIISKSDYPLTFLKKISDKHEAIYEMGFSCYRENGQWDDPEFTMLGQINDLVSKIGIGNPITSAKKGEKNNKNRGYLEVTILKN